MWNGGSHTGSVKDEIDLRKRQTLTLALCECNLERASLQELETGWSALGSFVLGDSDLIGSSALEFVLESTDGLRGIS